MVAWVLHVLQEYVLEEQDATPQGHGSSVQNPPHTELRPQDVVVSDPWPAWRRPLF